MPQEQATQPTHLCDLCSQPRQQGSLLSVRPGEDPVWVCRDCRHMLELQVDDHTPGGD